MNPLTKRQKEVLRLAVDGEPYKLIADHLGITTHAVQRHMDNIRERTGIEPFALLVRYALKQGIVGNEFEKNNQRKNTPCHTTK